MTGDTVTARVDAQWQAGAACRDRLDLPWTTDAADVTAWDADAIRSVCSSCPVRVACEAAVFALGVVGGWWAGTDRDPDAQEPAPPSWVPVRVGRSGRVLDDAAQGVLPLDDLLGGVA